MRGKLNVVTQVALVVGLSSFALAACGSDDGDSDNGGGEPADCWPTAAGCGLDGAGEKCVAWHDNSGATNWSFRMSQLEVKKPEVLAGEFLQNNVVSKGISLNKGECYQEGTGLFTWLMEIDPGAGIAKTGGARVQLQPSDGYCYIQQTVEGFPIEPVEVGITSEDVSGTTTYRFTEEIPDLTVAIFLTEDESSAIILPLHAVMMKDLVVSDENNCIGAWRGDELSFDNNCKPTREQKMPWTNAATLTGYIEIEEADQVWIPEMAMTLCVALSGSSGTYGEDFEEGDREGLRCSRDGDGKIEAAQEADWCSDTNEACSRPEADAFRLEGEFAASAVKILDACP